MRRSSVDVAIDYTVPQNALSTQLQQFALDSRAATNVKHIQSNEDPFNARVTKFQVGEGAHCGQELNHTQVLNERGRGPHNSRTVSANNIQYNKNLTASYCHDSAVMCAV